MTTTTYATNLFRAEERRWLLAGRLADFAYALAARCCGYHAAAAYMYTYRIVYYFGR